MENNFGFYPILLRTNGIVKKTILDFFDKIIESKNNKIDEESYQISPNIKGIIFDMLPLIKNNKKENYEDLIQEIKRRKLDILIDPYTNNLYNCLKRSENPKNKGEYPLFSKLIKRKILSERNKEVFIDLVKGGINKGIRFSLSLEDSFLFQFLKLQKEFGVKKYIVPYVPLNPPTFRVALIKNQEMIKNAENYLTNVLSIKDLKIIPIICVTKNMLYYIYGRLDKQNKKIVKRAEWSAILEEYKQFPAETLIIKIDNFDQYERNTKDFGAIRYFFLEVRKLFPDSKIIFSDFNEFSYKLILEGLQNYATPICKSVFRGGGSTLPTPEKMLGKYYIEKDMEYYFINKIGDKLDNCFFCKLLRNKELNANIDKRLWGYCRFGHFINAKNNEANKINKAKEKGQLKLAINDMFANSKNLKSLSSN